MRYLGLVVGALPTVVADEAAAVDVGGVEVVAVEERADLREKLRWNGMVAA
jgi:hypothetical protein